MECVDGFELGRIGPSLEFAQRARIMVEVCEAVHHAHTLGLQHRDLKPSNIMLDAQLVPRILDFGLSAGDPSRGHFVGTVPYVAPEQLDRVSADRCADRRLRTRRRALRAALRTAAVDGQRRVSRSKRISARRPPRFRSRSTHVCPNRCRPSR